jgi:hypothetical protein
LRNFLSFLGSYSPARYSPYVAFEMACKPAPGIKP